MSAFLLDTSAILAHYRNEVGADAVQALFADPEADLYLAAPSVAELARRLVHFGASSASAREAALAYASLVTKVIPVDTAVSIRAFELAVDAVDRVPLIDSIIAACALACEATLVHRDGHFGSLAASAPAQLHLR